MGLSFEPILNGSTSSKLGFSGVSPLNQNNIPLSFSNYNSATTNGLSLGTTGVAANQQLSLGNPANVSSNLNLANAGITDTSTVLDNMNPQSTNQGPGFWSKDGGAGMLLGGVQVLGNLWSSYQAHKIAKEQMAFAREQWDTNLENQTQTYNTALEDRIRGRYAAGVRSDSEVQNEIDRHSL
jgi:hypothetical protein